MTARDLADQIGINEGAVRNIIAGLESEGYIEKSKEGRRVSYKIHPELPFRRSAEKDQPIKITSESLRV